MDLEGQLQHKNLDNEYSHTSIRAEADTDTHTKRRLRLNHSTCHESIYRIPANSPGGRVKGGGCSLLHLALFRMYRSPVREQCACGCDSFNGHQCHFGWPSSSSVRRLLVCYSPNELSGTVVRQRDKTYSCYGSRQT